MTLYQRHTWPTAAWPSRAAAQPEATCKAQILQPAQIRCFLEAAVAAKQPAICERAKDPAVRFNCLTLYAERSLDPAPCRRILAQDRETQALRDACVSGVAIARRDPDLCEQASLPLIRDSCLMLLVRQHGFDPAVCERIAETKLKAACRDTP
jgi:hypothetical protein